MVGGPLGPSGMQNTRRRRSGPINIVLATNARQLSERGWHDTGVGIPVSNISPALGSTAEHNELTTRQRVVNLSRRKVVRHRPVNIWAARADSRRPPRGRDDPWPALGGGSQVSIWVSITLG